MLFLMMLKEMRRREKVERNDTKRQMELRPLDLAKDRRHPSRVTSAHNENMRLELPRFGKTLGGSCASGSLEASDARCSFFCPRHI
jgi:hypothetical protein